MGESYAFGSAVGREEGLGWAVQLLSRDVGDLYAAGKDDKARDLRMYLRKLQDHAATLAEATENVRTAQNMKRR